MIKVIAGQLFLLMVATFSDGIQERGCRGILPLRSTISDVKERLGESSDACQCIFHNPNETVRIAYAKGPCKGPPYGWNVSSGTVLEVTVFPKTSIAISSLGLDAEKYIRSQDIGEMTIHYTNIEEGIKYAVQNGAVHSISYIPSSKDSNLRCEGFPSYDGGIREYQPYASFSIKAQMIDERLDEFAAQLAHRNNTKGYIITYAGQVSQKGEAKIMAEKAKQRLTDVRNIPASKIITIDGGFRETAEYELFLIPLEMLSPTPTPTVSSNQVKIIGKHKRKLRRKACGQAKKVPIWTRVPGAENENLPLGETLPSYSLIKSGRNITIPKPCQS
jgi:hypothetical protein